MESSGGEPPFLESIECHSLTGPMSHNSCPEIQSLDWWREWQGVVGEEHLPEEPTEAEFDAWLEYREGTATRRVDGAMD